MSLGARIEELAYRTGAPDALVESVRTLFRERGIPLETDAEPYEEVLEETFGRQAAIRDAAEKTRRGATELQQQVARLGLLSGEHKAQWRWMRETLERHARELSDTARRFQEILDRLARKRRPGRQGS